VSVSWRQMRRMRLPSASHHLPIALQLAVLYFRHARRRRYLGVRRCTKSREMSIGRVREAWVEWSARSMSVKLPRDFRGGYPVASPPTFARRTCRYHRFSKVRAAMTALVLWAGKWKSVASRWRKERSHVALRRGCGEMR
jgi:hypothetical protein